MKKFLSLFLVLLVLFGCTDKPTDKNLTPQEKYAKTVEVLNGLENYEVDMKILGTIGGEKFDAGLNINMKMENVNTGKEPNMAVTMAAEGQEISFFVKDGYAYMNMLGMKVKFPATEETTDMGVNIGINELDATLTDRLEVKEENANGFILGVKCTQEELEALAWTEELKTQLGDYDIDLKDCELAFAVSNDYELQQILVSYNLTIKEAGSETATDAVFEIALNFKGHNKTTIDYPTDLETYVMPQEN